MNRLTDHDRNFGPLTIARHKWPKAFSVSVSSGGDDEDEEGYRNHLSVQAFNWCLRLLLPNLIRPFVYHQKFSLPGQEEKSYPVTLAREFGFNFYDGDSFAVLYGAQQGCNNLPPHVKEKRKHWFLPWAMWRHIRTSFYDQNGAHFWSEPDTNRMTCDERSAVREDYWKKKEACPKAYFWIEDYDGEIIKVTTHIEEREWLRGEKWCSWLSLFFRPKIRRDLDISFSRETGREKGSWKGGTIGTGIPMLPGELHEAAFRRFCEQDHRSKSGAYRVKFLGAQAPACLA